MYHITSFLKMNTSHIKKVIWHKGWKKKKIKQKKKFFFNNKINMIKKKKITLSLFIYLPINFGFYI